MKIPPSFYTLFGSVLCTTASLQAAMVTFQLDMSAQIALGHFDPVADSAFVAGNTLNNWSTTESQLNRSSTNPNLWVGTFDVAADAGSTLQYKFLTTTSGGTTAWEGNVGSGGGNGNRTLVLAAGDQTVPPVYFNNVSSSTTVSPNVTFQIDMSVQNTQGNFDPSSGTVNVAGEFNAWSTSAFELTNSAAN